MPLPTPYNSQQSVIATYDYTDIEEGTGTRLYYLANATGPTYFMAKNQVYSTNIQLLTTADTTNSYTFDLSEFKLPQVVKGKAYLSYGYGIGTAAHGSTEMCIYKLASDGTTETALVASGAGTIKAHTGAGETGADTVIFEVPETVFEINSKLRIKLKVSSTSDWTIIGCDPMNRNFDYSSFANYDTSQFKCYIPFRLENA